MSNTILKAALGLTALSVATYELVFKPAKVTTVSVENLSDEELDETLKACINEYKERLGEDGFSRAFLNATNDTLKSILDGFDDISDSEYNDVFISDEDKSLYTEIQEKIISLTKKFDEVS